MSEPAVKQTLVTGWSLLAVSLPFGVTLEALHGWKVQAYLASEKQGANSGVWRTRTARLLGMLCLVFAALAERHAAAGARASIARLLAPGAVLLPLGLFLGGILNSKGDPSFGVILVPVGAALLVGALVQCARKAT